MRLITGPAGSGKTASVIEEFRQALRAGLPGSRLLVPTATLAQHLQNQLAREGFVLRRGAVQTLSGFVRALTPDLQEAPDPVLYLIVEAAARRVARPEFARVVDLPGFCASLKRDDGEWPFYALLAILSIDYFWEIGLSTIADALRQPSAFTADLLQSTAASESVRAFSFAADASFEVSARTFAPRLTRCRTVGVPTAPDAPVIRIVIPLDSCVGACPFRKTGVHFSGTCAMPPAERRNPIPPTRAGRTSRGLCG